VLIKKFRELHEHVEPADRFHAASHIGHDLSIFGKHQLTKLAGFDPSRRPEIRIDAVEDRVNLGMKSTREALLLPARGADAGIAILQVEQDGSVAGASPELVDLRHQEFGTKVHVGILRVVEELEVIENRTIVELAQENGCAESGVTDD